MAFIVAGAIVAGTAGAAKLGMALSGRKGRIAEQNAAKAELRSQMQDYKALDISNPYANMQNTMEDLTVNQQQAQFQSQQGAQQRANIMQGMQGAAGGSGVAALAQAMANQGQLSTQKISASIGAQEASNQMAAAKQAGANQLQERKGDERTQNLQMQKTATLLGMSQQRVGAANQARAQARAAQMGAIGDIAGAGLSMATAGMKARKPELTDNNYGLDQAGSLGGLGLEGGGFSDPGFGMNIEGGITGPTIDQFGNTKFKDLSNLKIR